MVRSCTGQNSKTTNKWKVDQHHQANLTINLRSKSIKNLTNNDRQSRQNAQPYKALKCKYMGCKEDKDFKSHCKAWNETTGNEKSEARRKNR